MSVNLSSSIPALPYPASLRAQAQQMETVQRVNSRATGIGMSHLKQGWSVEIVVLAGYVWWWAVPVRAVRA